MPQAQNHASTSLQHSGYASNIPPTDLEAQQLPNLWSQASFPRLLPRLAPRPPWNPPPSILPPPHGQQAPSYVPQQQNQWEDFRQYMPSGQAVAGGQGGGQAPWPVQPPSQGLEYGNETFQRAYKPPRSWG